jgi:hypothetical protein
MSTFRQKVQAATGWATPGTDDRAGQPDPRTRSPRSRPAAQASIPAHPLVPAFAALWFAALFGLGSLAISSSALGALVTMIGLPMLVPAAAPPLGFTAHLLVAFALTVAGAVFGLVLALRLRPQGTSPARPVEVARPAARPAPQPEADLPPKVRARDAHPDAPPRRPLVLTEAFDEPLEAAVVDAVEAPAPLLRRKPGQAAGAVLASEPEPWIPVFTPGGEAAVQPLDLGALDLASLDLGALDLASLDLVQELEAPAPFAEPALRVEVVAKVEPETVVRAPEPQAPPVLLAATPQLPRDLATALSEMVEGSWSPVAGVPLGSLGLVQLIERLALAIAARKVASEAEAAAAVEPEPVIAPEAELAEPEFVPGPFSQPAFAHRAMSAPSDLPATDVPSAGSAREAILRRLGALAAGDADPAADQAPLFSRPARIVLPTDLADAVVPLHAVEASAAPVSQRGPAAFAAPAPGSAPTGAAIPVPFEADDALRSALATLQRMTARG